MSAARRLPGTIVGSEVGQRHPLAYPRAYPARTSALSRWLTFLRLTWSRS